MYKKKTDSNVNFNEKLKQIFKNYNPKKKKFSEYLLVLI